ncbi:MAG TPA: hypothetical protein VHH73_17795 [Verrucomicrobiae bacterium]|nr:hypothetical protein [Verrucomicrobiae bacterium]
MNASNPVFHRILATLFLAIGWLAGMPVVAQHGHIYAGIVSPGPGAPLWFQNGDVWDTNSYGGFAGSPACIYFDDNIPDLYPGLYQTATTFVALPATIFTGGPSPYAASPGTYVELKFVSLQGPPGGTLKVWNEIDDPGSPFVMLSLPVGVTNGASHFNLSEGDPSDPSADPYGHIHGRRFTLDKPGLYTVGLQLIDTSLNGPVQSPSAVTYFYLQAGLSLGDFSVSNHLAIARFGLPGSTDYVVESSPVMPGTNWVTVTNIVGSSRSELRWVADSNATTPDRFYRVRKAP